MRPLLCCSVRRQGSWKGGNCVLTAGYRPIIHQEGNDSNANKCHNPVLNYIPSKNVTVAGNDKKNPASVDTHLTKNYSNSCNWFSNHPNCSSELRWIFVFRQKKRVPSASLADALRVWELGETSSQSGYKKWSATTYVSLNRWLKTYKYEMVLLCIFQNGCVET